jgi:hypothetical protein
MIKMNANYTKSGDTSWDYFLDPATVSADHAIYETWAELHPNLYGTQAQQLFGINFTFDIVSPQELRMLWEIPDVPTFQAWVNHFTSFSPLPATDMYELMSMLYPGETLGGYGEIIEAPDDLYDTAEFIWMKTIGYGPDPRSIIIPNK